MNINLKQPVLGVLYGNRDFFPDQLVTEARADLAKVFAKFGIKAIQLFVINEKAFKVGMTRLPGDIGHARAFGLVVIFVYISNSFSSRSVSFLKRRPM